MTAPILRRVLLSLLLIFLLLGAGFGALWVAEYFNEPPDRKEAQPNPLVVDGMRLERGRVVEQLRGYGLAEPLRKSVISAQVSGEVMAIPAGNRVGAKVEEGELLARVNQTQNKAEVKRREALLEEAREDLASAQAQLKENRQKRGSVQESLELAQRELERQRQLQEEGAVGEAAVDQARDRVQSVEQRLSDIDSELAVLGASVKRARKSIEARQAELEQAQKSLEDTTIEAPFAARIDQKLVDEGDYVQPGQALFQLVDTSALELPIEIPASRALALEEGAPATLLTDEAPPRRAEGHVERISPTVSPENRTMSAYVVIRQEDGEVPFAPGTFLTASVRGRVFENTFAVPRSAIVDGHIYLAKDGKAQRLTPEFFVMLDELALTRDEIEEGSILIISGFERLYDGAPVRVPDASEGMGGEEIPSTLDTQMTKLPGDLS